MKTRSILSFLVATAAVVLSVPVLEAAGATILYSGSVMGQQVVDWRTPATAKTKDLDGDNIYGGIMGAVDWYGATGMQDSGSQTRGWALIQYGSTPVDGTTRMIDTLTTAPANNAARVCYSDFTFQLTGTNADYAGKTVRIGVMSDLLKSADWTSDNYKGYQLLQTVGGTGDSGQLSIRSGQGGDTFAEMYFFDITNAHAGDQFQLKALKNIGGISFSEPYLGPVTFDIGVPVPEPTSVALLAAACLIPALVCRRRGNGPEGQPEIS